MGSQPARFEHVSEFRSRLESGGWWHSFELPDGTLLPGANALEAQRERLNRFPIPQDLHGKRALDIGTWDGWFAFELERRGADVMAVDVIDNPRFREMHRIYNSRVDYRQLDVYDLTPARVGQFDVVLFMGVFYHLKHPLLGLERVCALTTDIAAVDSFVLQEIYAEGAALNRPLLEFFENDEFGGQTDNWVAPNVPCLLAMCRTAGFARVEFLDINKYSASVSCHRKWEPATQESTSTLLTVMQHANYGINFDSTKDDYLTCGFRDPREDLKIADVKPSVGPYGVIPISVLLRAEGLWDCTFRLAPGLGAGWHDVQIRVRDRAASNAKRIAVDLPLRVGAITPMGLTDGITWAENQLDRTRGKSISAWFIGLPENADRANVRAWIDDVPLAVEWVEEFASPEAKRQVNMRVPEFVAAGQYTVRVEIGTSKITAGTLTILG